MSSSHFAYDSVQLLGHRISRLGLSTLKEKVVAILATPFPETIKKAHEVLGMFNYYHAFIQFFACITTPLYDELKMMKEEPSHHDTRAREKFHGRMQFPDTPATREAFERLKEALVSAPVLIHADFGREFILYIDVCYEGVTGTLHQISAKDNQEHPILLHLSSSQCS